MADTAERSPRREGSAQDAADVKDSVTEDLNIARSLAAAGIPVFVAYPDPEGKTPPGGRPGTRCTAAGRPTPRTLPASAPGGPGLR